MRTTLDLPDDLFRRAKARAALSGMKLKDLITAFVKQGLEQGNDSPLEPSAVRRLPNSIRKSKGDPPIPAISNEDVERILIEEDAGHAG